jgi:hypothetical protein
MYFAPRKVPPAIGEASGAAQTEVYAVQIAAGVALGALVGAAIHHPKLGALAGGSAAVLALRTPVTLLIALGLERAGLLIAPTQAGGP